MTVSASVTGTGSLAGISPPPSPSVLVKKFDTSLTRLVSSAGPSSGVSASRPRRCTTRRAIMRERMILASPWMIAEASRVTAGACSVVSAASRRPRSNCTVACAVYFFLSTESAAAEAAIDNRTMISTSPRRRQMAWSEPPRIFSLYARAGTHDRS